MEARHESLYVYQVYVFGIFFLTSFMVHPTLAISSKSILFTLDHKTRLLGVFKKFQKNGVRIRLKLKVSVL